MTFIEDFDTCVCLGESIHAWVAGFSVTAFVERDDGSDAPDERQEGFWPSLYKDAPGFIGPGNRFRQRFADAQAKAEAIMEAWKAGDWFYCGIVLSISYDDVLLDDRAASLWGIEANYPGTDNSNLRTVANELLPDAVARGREVLDRLRKASST